MFSDWLDRHPLIRQMGTGCVLIICGCCVWCRFGVTATVAFVAAVLIDFVLLPAVGRLALSKRRDVYVVACFVHVISFNVLMFLFWMSVLSWLGFLIWAILYAWIVREEFRSGHPTLHAR